MQEPQELINWRALSREITGTGKSINRNRIPKKHAARIQKLIDLIQNWQEETDGTSNSG